MARATAKPPAELHNSIRSGMRAALPLGVAVAAFGVSFGVLARAAGFHFLAAVLMSATTFGGSAQFAAASVLGAGGGVVAAVISAMMLNARYVAIGVSVAPFLRGRLLTRVLLGQLLVDESWAIGQKSQGGFDVPRMVGAGLVVWVTWVAGTAAGAAGAQVLSDPQRFGLDAAFPALFLALLRPQLRGPRAKAAAVAGAVIALALTPLLPVGLPIVAAATACLVGVADRRDSRGAAARIRSSGVAPQRMSK